MPDYLRLDAADQAELEQIQKVARVCLEKYRKARAAKGLDAPMLPYECSWAYEEEFRNRKGAKYAAPKPRNPNIVLLDSVIL
jgi:hypothetical protein